MQKYERSEEYIYLGQLFYLEDYGHELKIKRKVVFTCRGIKKAGRG